MLQVTIPEGLKEGDHLQVDGPSDPVQVQVPPNAPPGTTIQIATAPAAVITSQPTNISEASMAMVGTWDTKTEGCFGGDGTMVITESNEVLTVNTKHNSSCCWGGCCALTVENSGSRGVHEPSMMLNGSFVDVKLNGGLTVRTENNWIITNASSEKVDMSWQHAAYKLGETQRISGTMAWDMAAEPKTVDVKSWAGTMRWVKTA